MNNRENSHRKHTANIKRHSSVNGVRTRSYSTKRNQIYSSVRREGSARKESGLKIEGVEQALGPVKSIEIAVNKSIPQKVSVRVDSIGLASIHDKAMDVPEVRTKTKRTKRKNKVQRKDTNHEKKQSIESHIDELRKRALYCVSALVLGGAIGYHFQNEIIKWLVKPLGQQLFYTSPTGGFDFLIKICLFFGFLLSVPIIIYNFIKFLAPAVPKRVSYSTFKMLSVSVVLAVLGVAFAYYVSLPAALHFLNNFTNEQVQSLISAQEYFNFVMIYLAGFAVLFQMPLIFAFINKVTPLKPYSLMKKQRLVILGSFVIAAFLTPTPDPMNQTIMAIPIIGLYQTSIGVVWQDNKRQGRKAAKRSKVEQKIEAVAA